MGAALDQLPQVCGFGILLRAYRSGKRSGRGSWMREGSSLRCFVLTGVRSRFFSAELMSSLGQREAGEHGTGTKETCPPSPQSLSTSFAYSNPLCSTFWMFFTSDLHRAHPHLEASITDLGEMLPLLLRGTAGNCVPTCFFLTLEETCWDSPAEVKRCWLPSQLSAELQTPGDTLRIHRSPYLFPESKVGA